MKFGQNRNFSQNQNAGQKKILIKIEISSTK